MARFLDLVVKGGRCVTPGGTFECDLGILNGRIAALGHLDVSSAARELDARHLHVLPGVIDSQVHFREPGLEHKEDLASGTRAAALGGVTTVLEMPNTSPSTTTAAALADKLERLNGRAWVDVGFFVGASPENITTLRELERLRGCAGVKVFMGSSTGDLLIFTEELLSGVLRGGQRRVAIHAEDEARLRERRSLTQAPGATAALHPAWRDELSALIATKRCLRVARAAGRRVHVLHVTTAEELDLLEQHRDLATVEVTPQHLTFAAPECYERLGSLVQMNPPIRDARHQKALWRAVRDGLVDVVASDHAPHTGARVRLRRRRRDRHSARRLRQGRAERRATLARAGGVVAHRRAGDVRARRTVARGQRWRGVRCRAHSSATAPRSRQSRGASAAQGESG